MSRFPDDVLASIRQSVDLADLVGRYVPIKRSGKSYKACCPFHQEKTPSFHVWPEEGTWKCFGCQKGGNAFIFLMEKEGITFPEAVRQLAADAGITLDTDDDPAASEQASRLKRLKEVSDWACKVFEKTLWTPEGEVARAYLKRRGLLKETVLKFRLGFAPPGWQNLRDAGSRAGIPEADLVDLGLVRRKDAEENRAARLFDMFRDRVTFPICDTQGHVIAFGARTLGDDEPKYLNSPETPLFSKGRTVYALHLAKQEMLRSGEGAVMEGYTDVIMAHQCGWPAAVAGLGTALTREQASLVARYVKRLYLVYDGDAAGMKAAERNAPAFLPEEIETRVAVLPAGEDPCDTLLRAGLPALRACLAAGREAFEHLISVKGAAYDLSSVPGKAGALDAVLETLVPVTSEVRRALYLKRVSDQYGIQEEVVRNRFRDLRSNAMHAERRGRSREGSRDSGSRDGPLEGPASQPPRDAHPVAEPGVAAEGDLHGAPAGKPAGRRPAGPPPATEEQLLEALLGRPELCAEAAERLSAESVSHPQCRELFDRLIGRWEETGAAPDVEALAGSIEEPEFASFVAGLLARGKGKNLEVQGRDCIVRLAMQLEGRQLSAGSDGIAQSDAQKRQLSAEEGDRLRREVEFHRRRAGGV